VSERHEWGNTVTTKHIDIGEDFSPYLGPRNRVMGPHSGEEFRDDLLKPAFLANDIVVVHLDGILGFSASFFEEAFGGLVRDFGLVRVKSKVRFDARVMAHVLPLIESYMDDAEKARSRLQTSGAQ
jgi:hypothetical protein